MTRASSKGIVLAPDGYAIDKTVRRDGMRIHVYKSGFRTISEAKANMRMAIQEAFDRKMRREFDMRTLSQSFRGFLDDMSSKRALQTMYSLDKKVRKHFLSHFDVDGLTAKEITCSKVMKWYQWFGKMTDINSDTKNKLLANVREFMGYLWRKDKSLTSEEYQDIMGVLDNFAVRKAPSKEKAVWTDEQVREFINATPKDSLDRLMMSLLFYLGARIAEFLALTWDSVDFDSNVIRIDKQILKDAGGMLSDELKTNTSYRECWMEDWVRDMLLDYKESLNKEDRQGDRFLFHADGNSKRQLSFHGLRARWERYERIAGLPHTTPHSARHKKASELASLCTNEEEVKAASEFLGHSPSMMMEVYVHTKSTSMKNIMARSKTVPLYEK